MIYEQLQCQENLSVAAGEGERGPLLGNSINVATFQRFKVKVSIPKQSDPDQTRTHFEMPETGIRAGKIFISSQFTLTSVAIGLNPSLGSTPEHQRLQILSHKCPVVIIATQRSRYKKVFCIVKYVLTFSGDPVVKMHTPNITEKNIRGKVIK
ncbi:hypothetical protein TNCV_3917841 [Trichonephila clavipes]|nr:hypothetical protein TNCV_3917841 [Trichonephila clavipes]